MDVGQWSRLEILRKGREEKEEKKRKTENRMIVDHVVIVMHMKNKIWKDPQSKQSDYRVKMMSDKKCFLLLAIFN